MRSMISEYRDNSSINYTLEDKNAFSDVGYKVLRNEDTNGFIKCVKVSHNGKLKLVYDISGYKDLLSLVPEISLDSFLTIISRLLSIVIGVKENGFMEYKNINPSINNIYVDTNNLNVYMIYVPISYYGDKSEEIFVNELKSNIVQVMNLNRNLQGQNINVLRNNLLSTKSLEFILKELENRNRNEEIQQIPIDIHPNVKKKKSPFTALGKLFSKKKQKEEIQPAIDNRNIQNSTVASNQINEQANVNFRPQMEPSFMRMETPVETQKPMGNYINNQGSQMKQQIYDEDTSLLDDEPGTLVLKGTNTPVALSFTINKSEYLIGSNKDMVDGFIGFNKAVSRRHCKIINKNNLYYLQDVGSSNGTFLNSLRLQREVMTKINVGDKITIANIDFLVMEI